MKRFIKFLHIKNTHPIRGMWLPALCIFAFALFPTFATANLTEVSTPESIRNLVQTKCDGVTNFNPYYKTTDSDQYIYATTKTYNTVNTKKQANPQASIASSELDNKIFQCGGVPGFNSGISCAYGNIVLIGADHVFKGDTINNTAAYKCGTTFDVKTWTEFDLPNCKGTSIKSNDKNAELAIVLEEKYFIRKKNIKSGDYITAKNRYYTSICQTYVCKDNYEETDDGKCALSSSTSQSNNDSEFIGPLPSANFTQQNDTSETVETEPTPVKSELVPPTPVSTETEITVTGTVVDSENSEAVASATVAETTNPQNCHVLTNKKGDFSLTCQNISEIEITFMGYKPLTKSIKNTSENIVSLGTLKMERETETLDDAIITENRRCQVSIRVTDKNNTPISDATVTYDEETCTTDDDGNAQISGIPTHTKFQINISHTDYKSITYTGEEMDLCPNEPVKIVLSAAGDADTPPPQNNGDPDTTDPDVDLESTRQIDQDRIDELQENADAMREREQSLANRMIGGASMGAMGIGGMQVASALAEQSADDAAELDMTAYLATFRCDYGAGQNIRGGETNITLPGANILLPLYNEYTTLAADLKSRKESLGMAPGIESETILDATLYDNESIGIADGAYTSLSRALSNPTGADAAEWAAQRAETAEQLKTGAIVAGVGAAVGIAGNILTNYVGDQPRERSAEINAKYDALTELHDNTVALPANVPTTCPNNATGTYPNCQCTDNNHVYNGNLNQCDKCPGNKIPDENGTQCICPSGTFPDNDDNDTCKKLPTGVSPKCNPTYKSHMYINPSTGECSCLDGFQPDDENNLTQCICPDSYTIKENKCVKDTTPVVQSSTEITIPAKNLFELNSAELTEAAKNELEKFVKKFKTEIGNTSEYCITIIGHTDKSGDHLNINLPLSEERANAVKTALEDAGLEPANMRARGVGSTKCETTNPNGVDSACRKVEISATNSSCTDND